MMRYDRYDDTLLLTGRPASRSTFRTGQVRASIDTENTPRELETPEPEFTRTNYDTYQDYRGFTTSHHTAHQQNHPTRRSTAAVTSSQLGSPTPRSTMLNTKKRYRLKKSRPSEVDEMLFGKPNEQNSDRGWKAPWDSSRSVTPLLFDSTDRAGHYSTRAIRPSTAQAQSPHTKPWK